MNTKPTPEERLAHVAIVLKEPAFPGNIGATARAMKNMGITDLRIVTPPRDRMNEAYALAQHAGDIIDNAKTFTNLADAVADCHFVVGTTARRGGWRKKLQAPRELLPELAPTLAPNRIALLFGPEDRGLVNEDIVLCTHLVRIPTSKYLASLNLSQAVLVLAYEMFNAVYALSPQVEQQPKYATREHIEGMLAHLEEALDAIGFFAAGNREYFMLDLKRVLNRTRLEIREVAMFRGMARQMLWTAKRSKEFAMKELLERFSLPRNS